MAEARGMAVSVNADAALVYSAHLMDAYEVHTGSSVRQRSNYTVTDEALLLNCFSVLGNKADASSK